MSLAERSNQSIKQLYLSQKVMSMLHLRTGEVRCVLTLTKSTFSRSELCWSDERIRWSGRFLLPDNITTP